MSSHESSNSSVPMSSSVDLARHRRGTRLRIAFGTFVVLGALTAGYFTAGTSASSSPSHASLVAATTVTTTTLAPATSTTTVSLPNCGAGRDPFDPTNSPPPANSPTNC